MTARPALSVAAVAVGLTLLVGPAATADVADDGRWWVDIYDIEGFHAQGIDGSGVTVAVIDGTINLELPEFEGADITVHEPSYCYGPGGEEQPATSTDYPLAAHGSNVAAMVVGNGKGYSGAGVLGVAPQAKLLFYSVHLKEGAQCYDNDGIKIKSETMGSAILQAVADGADIISVSLTSSNEFADAMAVALRAGVVVVGGLSNQDEGDIGDAGVGISNGVVSVGAVGPDGKVRENALGPLDSPFTDVVAPGVDVLFQGTAAAGWEGQKLASGTSYATPITAGNIALAMQKYPQATSNQIIQSLIRNTGVEPHPLEYDQSGQLGYGGVDTISLLAADPTQYEDVNPLLMADEDSFYFWGATKAQIYGDAATAAPSPSASPAPTGAADAPADPGTTSTGGEVEASASTNVPLIIAIIALAVLVIAGVTIIVVVALKREKRTPHGTV